uniref:Uncharacterized protein n=1 Tax=Setaria italica TaxID=4555 RepID=K3YF56_SETIT
MAELLRAKGEEQEMLECLVLVLLLSLIHGGDACG